MKLADSGVRREYETGAVRETDGEKGRCDLLPLCEVAEILHIPNVLPTIDQYLYTGDPSRLISAIRTFSYDRYGSLETAMLEVAKHYADGAKKYSERNWQKGLPLHLYIDSAVRHLLKFSRGDTDEPHDRAFLWNLLCALWTQKNCPEMIDLPFADRETAE